MRTSCSIAYTNPPTFTPCKCVSVNIRVQLPSDVLKMHQSQIGSPELEGIHPRYVVYLVVVCCAGCKPFALIADVKDRGERRDRGLQSAMCRRMPRAGWRDNWHPFLKPRPCLHIPFHRFRTREMKTQTFEKLFSDLIYVNFSLQVSECVS